MSLIRTICRSINTLRTGLCMIPHIEKRKKGGEDAARFSPRFLAVADGVGGWAEHGVDPAIYANLLLDNVASSINSLDQKQDNESDFKKLIDPLYSVTEAWKKVRIKGSSTCALTILNPKESILHSFNIGDSGFWIFRQNQDKALQSVYESKETLHGFNFPKQLGEDGDKPKEGSIIEDIKIMHNDIIVMFSDGVNDNLEASQIKEFIQPFLESCPSGEILDLNIVAEMIVEKTFKVSMDKKHASPFQKGARKAGWNWYGGKPDDITVLLGQVIIDKSQNKESSQQQASNNS